MVWADMLILPRRPIRLQPLFTTIAFPGHSRERIGVDAFGNRVVTCIDSDVHPCHTRAIIITHDHYGALRGRFLG
jgi:hypothetical protein